MILNNYQMDKYGTIHQIDRDEFKYDTEYNNIYNTERYIRNSILLSALRIAFVKVFIQEPITHLLDFGYGNGDFLKVAMMAFEVANGYDISDYTPEGINRVTNIYAKYDVICFWDSLEHIPDYSFVKDLNTKYLAISMPYCHYTTLGEKWFSKWKHLKPNEHLHHFTPNSLCLHMDELGYDPVVKNHDMEDIIRKSDDKSQNIFCAVYKKRI